MVRRVFPLRVLVQVIQNFSIRDDIDPQQLRKGIYTSYVQQGRPIKVRPTPVLSFKAAGANVQMEQCAW